MQHIHRLDLPGNHSCIGFMVLAAGFALDMWAITAMIKARTSILPHRAADHLFKYGPFSSMRNPIYVGNTVATFGLGLALHNG